MSKGGVYGAFVACIFRDGTRKRFDQPDKGGGSGGANSGDQAGSTEVNKALEDQKKGKSPYSGMVFIKAPIVKFFGWEQATAQDVQKAKIRTYKRKYNGMEMEVQSMVSMGATGKSRSVTVRFTALQQIGGKKVASIKIAMPSSYTYKDMVNKIMSSNNNGSIAAIVSPAGKSMAFKTPYNPKRKPGRAK
jgi:hypothetical protein